MEEKTEIFLSIIETNDQEIFIINEEWNKGCFLLWPPKNVLKKNQTSLLNTISTSDWAKVSDFTILQSGIRSIKEANERLIFYCMYENTQDKIETDEARAMKRKHPMDYVENVHLDYNNIFDEQFKVPPTASTPETEDILMCDACGIRTSFDQFWKCSSCMKIFCTDCDKLYHSHPLRTKHQRVALKMVPKYPGKNVHNNEWEHIVVVSNTAPRKAADEVDLSDPTIIKVTGSVTKNNGVIPKPLKKTVFRRAVKNRGGTAGKVDIFAKPKNIEQGAVSLESGICNVCEKDADVKCFDCALEFFCSACDKLYHNHSLRTQHQRTAFKMLSAPRKAICVVDDEIDLSDSTINKVIGSATKNNGVIPKPLKKTVFRRADKNRDGTAENLDIIAKPKNTQQNLSLQCSICCICGTLAGIKCIDCAFKLFCYECDSIQHLHPLRNKHQRKKLCPETVTSQALPTSSHLLQTTLNQTLSHSMILDLPVVFEENLADTDKEIINLDDSSDKILLALHDVGKEAEKTEMRDLKGSFKKQSCPQTMSRKPVAKGKKRGTNSVGVKRIILTLKQVQKDMTVLLSTVKKIKTDQLAIKASINAFKHEITNLTEIVGKSKENAKKTIKINESFAMPGFPCKSVVAIRKLSEDCGDSAYSDQVAVRFKNLTAENFKDIGAAVKRIMGYMFSNQFLTGFSWTGQSSLNSEANQKENFSELTGVVGVIRQAATLNLLDTEKVREASLKAVKDALRRASQNLNRQASN